MKITKIPNFGRLGVYIDDVDFNHLTNEEWREIGKIHLDNLVTIIRKTNLTGDNFPNYIFKWGDNRSIHGLAISKKYNKSIGDFFNDALSDKEYINEDDRRWAKTIASLFYKDKNNIPNGIINVSGIKDESGKPKGLFADGELTWHSNESGNLTFTPGVALLAHQGVIGSATSFCTTVDWYESQSESFRSELDEMIIVHAFKPGAINPGLGEEQEEVIRRNSCPTDGERIPLVIQSPGLIKGLHFSFNTIDRIDGMSKEESDKLLERLQKEIVADKNIYDHWYQNNNDLCLFDNSIVIHRRLGEIKNRMCYRLQHDYKYIEPVKYQPYFQEEYKKLYDKQYNDLLL